MEKNTIISAVETHFADKLHKSGVQENGIDIDPLGQLIVTMQDHGFAFSERLRGKVQRFIDQYISAPDDSNWLRDEEYQQYVNGLLQTP